MALAQKLRIFLAKAQAYIYGLDVVCSDAVVTTLAMSDVVVTTLTTSDAVVTRLTITDQTRTEAL